MLRGAKTTHIGAFYRPDVSDETSLDELNTSLSRIPTSHSIIIGGDFNLPGCDWESGQVKNACKFPKHHLQMFDIVNDWGLTQHVTDFTRTDPVHGTESTLDLIMTNRPSSVISVSTVLGISDHDHPQIEIDIQAIRYIKKPRNIPQYKKADWEGFAKSVEEIGQQIMSEPESSNVEELWIRFRNAIQEGI